MMSRTSWFRRALLCFVTALVLLRTELASAQDSDWLHYDPEVVTLRGKVTTIVKYGPPGYGESPKIDDREVPIILVLPLPVRVVDTVTNLTHIQLVFAKSEFSNSYRNYIGKEVIIKGKLFEAFTGHHFTPVLLEVETVKILSATNIPQRSEKRFLADVAKPKKIGWVPRKPAIAQLDGDLTQVIKYGPPNYGDPETDTKLEVPLLMLLSPATVDIITDNVAYLQLIFPKNIRYQQYLDRTVRVTGTVSEASEKHHFTDVVMEVKSIVPMTTKK